MKNQAQPGDAPAAQESAPVVENPLLQGVEEQTYSQPNLKIDPSKLQQPIGEPQFTAPNIDAEKDIFAEEEEQQNGQPKAGGPAKQADAGFNQTLNELSPKDQERSAEHAASIIFGGYQKLHDAANWWVTISDDKIIKLQMEGELDTGVMVPYTSEEWMPLMQFIQEYNAQTKDFLKIDPEWRAQVEPALIRVLKKHKIGMSDEQFLIAKFGEDIVVKGIQLRMMRQTSQGILEFAKEQSRAGRQQPPVAPLTPVPGGQSASQQPAAGEGLQPPLTAVPGGQAGYEGPVSVQDHVRGEFAVGGNDGGAIAGVEHSEVPQFGDKKMLRNLGKVARKRAVAGKAKTKRSSKKSA